MQGLRTKESAMVGLALFALIAGFLAVMRLRLGPLYETILIDAAGVLQQRPWMEFSGRELREGFFPLWNPLTGFGQPHLANIQTAVFYPLNLVVYILGSRLGMELWMLVRLWLAGFFLYLFLRRLGLGVMASLAGSALWPLGGYGLWFMQLVELNSQLLLPLFLLLGHQLAEKAKLKFYLALVIIGWLVILGGHPEAVFNCWLLAALYFVFRVLRKQMPVREKWSGMALLFIGFATSLALASVVVLPFLNYFSRCWSLHYPGFGFFHLDIKTIGSLFVPSRPWVSRGPGRIAVELLGGSGFEVFRAGYLKTTVPGMLPGPGLVAVLLTALAWFRLLRAKAEFCFFSLVLVVLLGLTYGLMPFRWLAFLPWFSSASNYKFYFSEIHLCFSVLAGLGFSQASRRLGRWFPGLLFAVLVGGFFLCSLCINPYLLLQTKDLDQQPWVKFLEKKSSEAVPARMASIDDGNPALPPNLAMLFGINDLASSDALYPETYFHLMDELNGLSRGERLGYFYPQYYVRVLEGSLKSPLLGRYGVRWVVSNFFPGERIEALAREEFAQRVLEVEGVRRIKLAFQHVLLEKYSAWPRAFLVEDKFSGLGEAKLLADSEAEILSYLPERVAIRAHLEKDGYLVLTDLYYPGWVVWVDGEEARLEEMFEGFRGVRLGAGAHRLEFRFAPEDFRTGFYASLSGLLLMVGFGLAVWREADVKKS